MIWSAIKKCILQHFFYKITIKSSETPSKTKILITIGKETDADKPISEAPHAGQ